MNNKGFFKVTREIFILDKFKNLKPSSKILYMALCYLSSKYQYQDFFHSIKDLCKLSNLSNKSVINAKKELFNKGFITIKKNDEKLYDNFTIND